MDKIPYQIRENEKTFTYQVIDTRTGYIAHEFKHHIDAEACKDSLNSWVQMTSKALGL